MPKILLPLLLAAMAASPSPALAAEAAAHEERFGVYDREAMDAVDAFRKAHGLDHEGNPRGLVDERLVEALRREHLAKRRGGGPPRN